MNNKEFEIAVDKLWIEEYGIYTKKAFKRALRKFAQQKESEFALRLKNGEKHIPERNDCLN